MRRNGSFETIHFDVSDTDEDENADSVLSVHQRQREIDAGWAYHAVITTGSASGNLSSLSQQALSEQRAREWMLAVQQKKALLTLDAK